MKVAVYYNNRDVRIEEYPIPDLNRGEILVKTKACGVCVADTMEWYLAPRAPLVLGHEATGVVIKTGEGVEGLGEGDRVFVHHHVPCFVCEHCRRGNFTMCRTFRSTHLKPGGFAEYFVASALHVERDTLILPDEVSFEIGTLIEPLACVIHAVKKAGVKPEDSVTVIGAGVMGLMFIQTLIAFGVMRLAVYEIIPWRQKKALEFGAPVVFTPLPDQKEETKRLQGFLKSDGADKVFVVAKDIRAMELGINLTNKGGTTLFFATPAPEEYVRLYPSKIFFKEQKVMASYSASHLDTLLALDLLAAGRIWGEKLISHRFPLERLSEAILKTAERGESLKCIVTMEDNIS
ncbi:MAG: alcohol dehydrogenase catalytic domain-containing protein [Firmicutes bacterium]|nr:alcohol dehydrogenase catalytic domain-containing protein [Bacillota bacterium]